MVIVICVEHYIKGVYKGDLGLIIDKMTNEIEELRRQVKGLTKRLNTLENVVWNRIERRG